MRDLKYIQCRATSRSYVIQFRLATAMDRRTDSEAFQQYQALMIKRREMLFQGFDIEDAFQYQAIRRVDNSTWRREKIGVTLRIADKRNFFPPPFNNLTFRATEMARLSPLLSRQDPVSILERPLTPPFYSIRCEGFEK